MLLCFVQSLLIKCLGLTQIYLGPLGHPGSDRQEHEGKLNFNFKMVFRYEGLLV